MTAPADAKAKSKFIGALAQSIERQTFAKLTLGKFRGEGEARKAVATLVLIKDAPHLKIVTSLPQRDETKTLTIEDGINHVKAFIGSAFQSATVFSSTETLTLTYSRKGVPQLVAGKATVSAAEATPHDRAKRYLVPPGRPYLKALGVTDASGQVKPTMQGKYRQICRFIEIFDGLLREMGTTDAPPLSIVDIGAGKGYLTFAVYDHVTTALARACTMAGVEMRRDLAEAGNRLARDLAFDGLTFEAREAAAVSALRADVVMALHACDTATDDALAFGIKGGASLILSAPCCQHELAPQLGSPVDGLKGLTKFPLFKQRQADLVTDAARALILEASGYRVSVIEFVSTEHTAKNILIAAVKSADVDRILSRDAYRQLKQITGFSHHHLASQLEDVD